MAIPKNLRKLYEKYQADESNVLFCGMSGLEPWLEPPWLEPWLESWLEPPWLEPPWLDPLARTMAWTPESICMYLSY